MRVPVDLRPDDDERIDPSCLAGKLSILWSNARPGEPTSQTKLAEALLLQEGNLGIKVNTSVLGQMKKAPDSKGQRRVLTRRVHRTILALHGLGWPVAEYYDEKWFKGCGRDRLDEDPEHFRKLIEARQLPDPKNSLRLEVERSNEAFSHDYLIVLDVQDISLGSGYTGRLTIKPRTALRNSPEQGITDDFYEFGFEQLTVKSSLSHEAKMKMKPMEHHTSIPGTDIEVKHQHRNHVLHWMVQSMSQDGSYQFIDGVFHLDDLCVDEMSADDRLFLTLSSRLPRPKLLPNLPKIEGVTETELSQWVTIAHNSVLKEFGLDEAPDQEIQLGKITLKPTK